MNIGSEKEIEIDEKEVTNFNENFIELKKDPPEIQLLQTENGVNCEQKCHICDQFFQNLESHFASSHIKEENNDENTINDNPGSKDFESENFAFESQIFLKSNQRLKKNLKSKKRFIKTLILSLLNLMQMVKLIKQEKKSKFMKFIKIILRTQRNRQILMVQ